MSQSSLSIWVSKILKIVNMIGLKSLTCHQVALRSVSNENFAPSLGKYQLLSSCRHLFDRFKLNSNQMIVLNHHKEDFRFYSGSVSFKEFFTSAKLDKKWSLRRLIDNVPSFDCSFDNGICPGWKKQLPSEMVGMAVPWKTNFGNTATINSGPSGDKSELGLGSYMFADATDILRNVFENSGSGSILRRLPF